MFKTRQQNDDLKVQFTPKIDLANHKKVKVIYKAELTDIKGFTYKTPLVSVDDSGELSVSYSKDKETYVHAKKVTFLNLVGYELLKVEEVKDKEGNVIDRKPIKGKVVSYEPMDHVNKFILSKHIEEGKEESNQLSKGYFITLISFCLCKINGMKNMAMIMTLFLPELDLLGIASLHESINVQLICIIKH